MAMTTPTEIDVQFTDASNRETATTVEASTDPNFIGPATAVTVGADVGVAALTGLVPNTSYYIRLRNEAADGTYSIWTEGYGITPALPTIAISDLLDASELAPDGTPGTGYFLFNGDMRNSYNSQVTDPLPAMLATYTVDDIPTDDYPNRAAGL